VAKRDNHIDTVGVAPAATVMSLKAFGDDGTAADSAIAAAFDYAGDHGARIVNGSFGGAGTSDLLDAAMAAHPDTLFVVAAGNDGVNDDTTPHYPCNYGAAPDNLPNVICVAATDSSDTLASFSNYGASVDLAAPGVGTTSTWPAYANVYTEGFESLAGWTNFSGGTFGQAPIHTGGSFSAADSPFGNYSPSQNTLFAFGSSVASLAGRQGCQYVYNLNLATELGHDYFMTYGSANGLNFSGSGWSGSTGGTFHTFTTDMSPFDGSPTFYPGLGVFSDANGTVGDGGYIDDLVLRCLNTSGEDYNTISGTSMATPHVAGVAARYLQNNRTASPATVRNAIVNAATLGRLSGIPSGTSNRLLFWSNAQ